MTYREWLIEVDKAFEQAEAEWRSEDISPEILLREYEKGTTAAEFSRLPLALLFGESPSSAEGKPSSEPMEGEAEPQVRIGPVSGFYGGEEKLTLFTDTAVLDSLDKGQASFVVRCMTGLGWLCFALAGLAALVGIFSLLPGNGSELRPVNGGPNLSARIESPLRSIPFLSGAFSLFVLGLTLWWGSALLRGFYYMLGRNRSSD